MRRLPLGGAELNDAGLAPPTLSLTWRVARQAIALTMLLCVVLRPHDAAPMLTDPDFNNLMADPHSESILRAMQKER